MEFERRILRESQGKVKRFRELGRVDEAPSAGRARSSARPAGVREEYSLPEVR
jgi:hypothetical protein